MADLKLAYGTASDVTITLASLASDTNLLTGRESTAVDNIVAGPRLPRLWEDHSGDGTDKHRIEDHRSVGCRKLGRDELAERV